MSIKERNLGMAEVVVLGSGTSMGVPALAVDYTAEFLANPKNHRTRSSILIKAPLGNILVDCTPDMRLQLLREHVKMVDSVIITHTHADHVMGMDDLRCFVLAKKDSIPIYTGPQFQEDIKRIYKYAFEKHLPGISIPRFELIDIPERFELCGLNIQTMWVNHGTIQVIALRINDFAYVTDVNEIPEKAWNQLQGLDILMLDSVRFRPHPNHFNLEQALDVIEKLKPKMAYLTHLNHDFDHDVVNATLPENVKLAYDGLKLQV
jgi:phosphoribosyl 1,2-cyclic phosphate phosphodiesterase